MSYYTQSGNRRSDRIAGNPPEHNQNPQQNNAAQNTFSPFNDTQAAADGVSYGSSNRSTDIKNINPTQEDIAFLQQPSQASTNSRSSTPIQLRGKQIKQNSTHLASTNVHHQGPYTNQIQRSNPIPEDFLTPGPPQPQQHGPASAQAFNPQPTVNKNHLFQPQSTMSTNHPFDQQQPHQTFSTPFNQPIQQQHYNHQQRPPVQHQQHQFRPQQHFQYQPNNINLDFAQPPSQLHRIQQLESRLTAIEDTHRKSHQHLIHEMSTIVQLLQQNQQHSIQPPAQSSDANLLNLQPPEMHPTDHPSVKLASNQPPFTPPVVDLTNDDAPSHITLTSTAGQPPPAPTQPHPPPPTTPHSIPHTIATNQSTQQPIIVQVEGKKDLRLNFKTFKSKKDDYESWKATCLSKIRTSGMYPTATIEDASSNLTFNPSMSNDESRLIVQQTIDNLDEPSHFTTGENLHQIKAHALWETLDAFYGAQSKVRGEDDDHTIFVKQWANRIHRRLHHSLLQID